jgi:hypothetical protein
MPLGLKRPCAQPAQYAERSQLGMSHALYKSLLMSWTRNLIADAVLGMQERTLTEEILIIDLLEVARRGQVLLGLPYQNESIGCRGGFPRLSREEENHLVTPS